MSTLVYISAWSIWAPELETRDDWITWLQSPAAFEKPTATPRLEHVDAMFKRRLSQLTRMTIHVGHEALAGQPPMKISFASVYGEIRQQYKITDRLISDGDVSPANFSLSVFNTPVAALSITEKNTEGYTACYPGPDAFSTGAVEAVSEILAGCADHRLFIVADETPPDEYAPLCTAPSIPYALALVFSKNAAADAIPVSLEDLRNYTVSADDVLPPALLFARDVLFPHRSGGL